MIDYKVPLKDFTGKCPIWGTPAYILSEASRPTEKLIFSPRAGGRYYLTDFAGFGLETVDPVTKARTSAWILRNNLSHDVPMVDDDLLSKMGQAKSATFHEKADAALMFIHQHCEHLGAMLKLNQAHLYPTAGLEETHLNWLHLSASIESKSNTDTQFILEWLHSQGYIDAASAVLIFTQPQITGAGYSRIDELERVSNSSSNKVFVAMWFDASMEDVFDKGIEPSVEEDCGYDAVRIDRKEHNNKIDDEIIAEIREAKFIVADFTSGMIQHKGADINIARGGVYYEAGFAQGQGKEVIWTCRKDMIDHVHFDTRQFAHIVWETPEDLREKLTRRIRAVIGKAAK